MDLADRLVLRNEIGLIFNKARRHPKHMEKFMSHFALPNGKKRGRPARSASSNLSPRGPSRKSPVPLRVLCLAKVEANFPSLCRSGALQKIPSDLLIALLQRCAALLTGPEVAELLIPRLAAEIRSKSLHTVMNEAPASRILPPPQPSQRLLSVLHPHSEPLWLRSSLVDSRSLSDPERDDNALKSSSSLWPGFPAFAPTLQPPRLHSPPAPPPSRQPLRSRRRVRSLDEIQQTKRRRGSSDSSEQQDGI